MRKYTVVKRVVVAYRYNVEAQNLKKLKDNLEDYLPVQEDSYQWEDDVGVEIFSETEANKRHVEAVPMATMEAGEY